MLRDLGRAYLNLPCGEIATDQQGHARGRVQRTVYKVLECVEKYPFFSLDVPIPWLEPEVLQVLLPHEFQFKGGAMTR